jgi:hypothetical protein
MSDVPQLEPPQQGWPAAPQAQLPPLHTRSGPHATPQHGWLAPPHATQLPLEQVAPGLHAEPPQHICPTPPQAQVPLTQARLLPQVVPQQG